MTLLADIIEINASQTDAAVVLERSLDNQDLVRCFAPTKAAIKVFEHICKAALPQATQEQRAINLFGNYGSGKSHLAVVLAQLLRDGCGGDAFSGLFQRLNNFGETQLATKLENTFLKADDKDAKPYLLISLYGSDAPTLSAQLMEGLYDALERHPELNHQAILPTTEYEVAVKRFDEMVANNPALENMPLPRHLIKEYSNTKEMREYLKQHRPEALILFKEWHKEICHGALFNPANDGGKGFIEAYKEAGKNLAEKHNFSGILVIWDEFGFALEDLLTNIHRSASNEIMELQRFVETVCASALGHTLFIGLSHVSFEEYGGRLNVSQGVKDSLDRISGRFTKPSFEIKLSASESEGYHLLGMQRKWTEQGKALLTTADTAKNVLFENCRQLPLFNTLGNQLIDVINEIYPLHPIAAAGLFALSAYAQSNRTALTFFRDNANQFLYRKISDTGLFSNELIRLPEIVEYFFKNIKEKSNKGFEHYEHAVKKIPNDLPLEEQQVKQSILKICLLSELIVENFQPTEQFLSIALYDKPQSDILIENLLWLRELEVIWKNELTGQWTLSGNTGVDIEAKITEQLPHFVGRTPEELFRQYPDLLADLLPQIGEHELEPSACGIVRSYQVELLSSAFNPMPKLNNPLISGKIYLVFSNTPEEAEQIKQKIETMQNSTLYFWLPLAGIKAEFATIETKRFNLNDLLCRYLALEVLLKQKTNSEELHRQLNTKWEKTRQEALALLRVLFSRDGLQSGKSQLFKAGTTEPLNCHSWHDIRQVLAEDIKQLYPAEIPIRANNMNKLNDEKYTGSKKIFDIVDRILKFSTNPDYQTDLLGENGTSEQSAIIDGILGANQLFIQRPTGLDIKNVNETDNPIRAVLKLIHDTLLRKRESPYPIKKLRDELIAPPYGIPACNLAIFAAVAIRHEVKRLRWGSTKEAEFSKNLTNAFDEDSKITIRLFEFSSKQFAMLFALGKYFQVVQKVGQIQEDYANDCSYKLRDFIKQQPETIKNSPKLQDKTRELVKFFNNPFYSPQELAEFLIKLLEIERESEGNIASKSISLLKDLLDDFAKIGDERLYQIKQSWQRFINTDAADLISRLSHERSSAMAKNITGLIKQGLNVDINQLTMALVYKPFEQCNDSDIGKCDGLLSGLKDYHPPIIPVPTPTPQPLVINEPEPVTPEQLINKLRVQINSMQLPRNIIKTALEQLLLSDYKDE